MEDIKIDQICIGHRSTPIELLNMAKKSVCKISTEKGNSKLIGFGTGFFMRISDSLKYLFTNYRVVAKDAKEIKIEINNQKNIKINLENRNVKYFEKPIDITIVEIKESDIFYKEIEFLSYDSNYKQKGYLIYKNVDVFSIEYPHGQEAESASGKIININGNEFEHNIPTEKGSSGSPIILLNSNKNFIQVIGIHKNANTFKHINGGSFIGVIIEEIYTNLNRIENNNINKEINKSSNQNSNKIPLESLLYKYSDSFILSEFLIDDISEIRIINSYEEQVNNTILGSLPSFASDLIFDSKYEEDLKNENEIKQCEIRINKELIPFEYIHKFRKGKYIIKYSFKNNLKKINHMFFECKSLISIDLSNLNAHNIVDMSYLFSKCSSLKFINLSNFKSQNLKDINHMFDSCTSLEKINLSNFNTESVSDMNHLFYGCSSLKSLDLSYFNTQNTVDMESMFENCSSLEKLDLSNFITQNVTKMNLMFYGCKNLKYLNLSNFGIDNTNNNSEMFGECNSLKSENIIVKDNRIFQQIKEDNCKFI